MWKEILEYLRQIVTLTERTEKNRNEIAALQKELADFAKATEKQFASIKLEFQRLNERITSFEKDIQNERKLILLQLENRLLRAKLQLPPADDDSSHE